MGNSYERLQVMSKEANGDMGSGWLKTNYVWRAM